MGWGWGGQNEREKEVLEDSLAEDPDHKLQ